MRIVRAVTPADVAVAKTLIEEYGASLTIDLEFQGFREEIAEFPRGYSEPDGAVLVAYEGNAPAGVVALRRHDATACEMKRLYVRPSYRGKGVGRKLSEELIRIAARQGYARMRLDTLADMYEAIALYRALGFRAIPPYRFNPVEGAQYMELDLEGR